MFLVALFLFAGTIVLDRLLKKVPCRWFQYAVETVGLIASICVFVISCLSRADDAVMGCIFAVLAAIYWVADVLITYASGRKAVSTKQPAPTSET
jgi:threonine/homoserine efflux transporter RhtA